MAATITLWRKHMLKFFRSREAAFGMLMQPILWVVLFGVGMQSMFRSGDIGFTQSGGYIAFMMPGIIVLSALAGAVAGGAILLDERLRGIIKEYLAAPIPRASILMGSAASTVTKGLFQALVITLIGIVLGAVVVLNPLNWLAALVMITLYSLGIAGLALAVAARVRSSLGYHGLIALDLPLVFASSAFYPLAQMPDWMRWIALFNPTTYVIEATRWLLYGITMPQPLTGALSLGVLLVFALLGMGLAARAFQREVRARGGTV
jgi:ABC-2 type transport system permease protein